MNFVVVLGEVREQLVDFLGRYAAAATAHAAAIAAATTVTAAAVVCGIIASEGGGGGEWGIIFHVNSGSLCFSMHTDRTTTGAAANSKNRLCWVC